VGECRRIVRDSRHRAAENAELRDTHRGIGLFEPAHDPGGYLAIDAVDEHRP
jgi:hypothetical protein